MVSEHVFAKMEEAAQDRKKTYCEHTGYHAIEPDTKGNPHCTTWYPIIFCTQPLPGYWRILKGDCPLSCAMGLPKLYMQVKLVYQFLLFCGV